MSIKPEYPVVLRPLSADDGGGWIALVPDLPGCISDGPTAKEALENVEGAIAEWKQAAQAMGRPVPRPDASLERSLEQEVPDYIRRQAENYARQISYGPGGDVDPSIVHAIIAEWARAAAHRIRL